MERPIYRNLVSLFLSQFASAFSFNFINVFLPFYVLKVSTYSPQETLLWIGAIMAAASLTNAISSPFWGALTHRFSPKLLYLRALLANGVVFFFMGFTTDVAVLLILRTLLGIIGGTSTVGFIITSASSSRERLTRDIGTYQSSITLGHLVGPPLGGFGALLLGYRGAFMAASAVLLGSFIFSQIFIKHVPRLPRREETSGPKIVDRRILVGWMLSFVATVHLMFLPSILPQVFDALGVEQAEAMKLAGTVVMLYTATAMIGTYVWSWMARRIGLYRLIILLFAAAIALQSMLAFARGVIDFTVIRMIQAGFVAATVPLVLSMFVREAKGGMIGLLNSARSAGNAVGPLLGTGLLAFSNLPTVYFSVSGLTLLILVAFVSVFSQDTGNQEAAG